MKHLMLNGASLDGGFTLINPSAAARLPNKTAKLPRTNGKHIVSLEVFHQLHCLVCQIVALTLVFALIFLRTFYAKETVLSDIQDTPLETRRDQRPGQTSAPRPLY